MTTQDRTIPRATERAAAMPVDAGLAVPAELLGTRAALFHLLTQQARIAEEGAARRARARRAVEARLRAEVSAPSGRPLGGWAALASVLEPRP